MIKLTDSVWKFSGESNVYLIELGENKEKILIDTGDRKDRDLLIKSLKENGILPEDINIVIMTHLHYDHLGNIDLLKNAKIYASSKEIKCLKENPIGTILNKELTEKITTRIKNKELTIEDADLLNQTKNETDDTVETTPSLKIINTPGHTKGSICIYLEKEKILFSGDTLFNGCHGRTDLPTSIAKEMEKSLKRLLKYDYTILCPGHDY
ncbi:MAG: MBL fold metallo-hydrolase [Nanoarchaeota archaeon]|nr:MBL fold metallo-hydrolase [Nanoarchaeota archaeon]